MSQFSTFAREACSVLLSVGFDVLRDDSQLDGLQLVGTLRVASRRRPRFAVGGLGTPVRSEIGPCQELGKRVAKSMAAPDYKNNPRIPAPDQMLEILATSF